MSAETKQEQIPNKFCDGLDAFIRSIGHVVMWTNGTLIFVIILQVILRYGFGHGLVILEELQWHFYALGIMFGASYAMMMDYRSILPADGFIFVRLIINSTAQPFLAA